MHDRLEVNAFMHFIFLFFSVLRAHVFLLIFNKKLKRVGRRMKLFGAKHINFGVGFCVGDHCWLEAVTNYRGERFYPSINIGSGVRLSDNVHISCVHSIEICDGVLIGSNVYIGDHSHGSTDSDLHGEFDIPPANRRLGDVESIYIGNNVWIGNGAVILAGAYIPDGSIVGANSVVKSKFQSRAIIAGVPAKEIRKIECR
jgi:acetyltransferase-like isoleucine patch superfamily enzyme